MIYFNIGMDSERVQSSVHPVGNMLALLIATKLDVDGQRVIERILPGVYRKTSFH